MIPALKNKDWRAEAEARRGGGPGRGKKIWVPDDGRQREIRPEDLTEQENTGEGQQWGLVITAPKEGDTGNDGEGGEEEEETEKPKPMTEDEAALAALMGKDVNRQDLVIAASAGDTNDWRNRAPENEDDAYRKDVSARPDVPTLADYAAVPVEEFGAALLRGMGWKGGEELHGSGKTNGAGKDKKKPKEKRPAFLGIGAKPQSEVPELGAWGKGDKGGKHKGKRVDTTYIPVVLVDKKTGKVVDEKEVTVQKKESGDGERRDTPKSDDGSSRRKRESSRDRHRRRGDEKSDRRERRSEHGERSSSHRDDRDRHRDRRRDDRRDERRGEERRDRDRRDRDSDRDKDRRRRRSRSRSRSRERHHRR